MAKAKDNKKRRTLPPGMSFYSVREVAKMFKVTAPSVRKMIREGELVAVKVSRSTFRISAAALNKFLEQSRITEADLRPRRRRRAGKEGS